MPGAPPRVSVRGVVPLRFPDGQVDTVRAGEAYYIEPGHTFEAVENLEYVEFSPADEQKRAIEVEVMQQNLGR
jgi:hypothetical protein